MFLDPGHPEISEDRFSWFYWDDFYKRSEETIPLGVPKPHGNPISIHVFVDSYHAGDKVTQSSQSGILIYSNMTLVLWYSKKKHSVKTLTFGSDFTALKQGIELTQAIR